MASSQNKKKKSKKIGKKSSSKKHSTKNPKVKKSSERLTKNGINLAHYRAAGFEVKRGKPQISNEKFTLTKFYASEGESSFYQCAFFGGVIDVQLIPLFSLPDFIERLAAIEEDEGQFYDKITLREGDRSPWGGVNNFAGVPPFDTAEELLLYLTQYKRHGALVGEGGTFDYIQVCFINFGG